MRFVLYRSLDDVKQESYSEMFKAGAMLIPDDMALIVSNPGK